jgi:hypothetical protein
MTISAVSSNSSLFQAGEASGMAQMKKNFESLGSALESGDLDAAEEALAQFEANAPDGGDDSNNPMAADMASLKSAIASGDVEAAQEIYAQIKEKMSQGPSSGQAPPGGSQGAQQTDTVQLSTSSTEDSESSSSSSETTVYDKKDTNKDGVVSVQEIIAYALKHPGEDTSGTTGVTTVSGEGTASVDTVA